MAAKEDFSIIIIPDTQNVSTSHPANLLKLTRWIVDHAEELNLKMILHLGDVVNSGALEEEQWHNHKSAFDLIDESNLPMMIAIGNHDYDNQVQENRNSHIFNKYCGVNRILDKPWFGGVFEEGKSENMFTKLTIKGRKYLFMTLEFGPRDQVIDWANKVLEEYSDHDAVLATHSYMYLHGERTKPGNDHNPKKYKGAHDANDGEDFWRKCINKHRNIKAVFSGHHIPDHVSYRYDLGGNGNLVFQSFQNWQCAECGGDGRIRILRYRTAENRVDLQVLNPLTGQYETNDGYEASFPMEAGQEGWREWLPKKHPILK
jgi:DNA repair exonuclease SbcCD nuclease subunit